MEPPTNNHQDESPARRGLFKFLNIFYWLSFLADFPWTLIGNSTLDKAAESDKHRRKTSVAILVAGGLAFALLMLVFIWALLL